MRVLLVGGGGREHALAWAIAKSPALEELIAAPGNPGIGRLARLVPTPAPAVDELAALAAAERADLVVAGPEAPLAAGLADRLAERGLPCFGPRRDAARLESSKAFAKDFCARHRIPTGRHTVVRDPESARLAIASGELGERPVVKASGLAGGKGVFLPDSAGEAEAAALRLLEGSLGEAGAEVVLEERLTGPEMSVFAVTDGRVTVLCGTAQDYKRRFENDEGPNTGGMGCVSPSPHAGEALLARIHREIVAPTVAGLAAEGRPYRGVLYAGLMLTPGGPKVLEFNIRFGDPEAQALLPRLSSDLLPVLHGAATGTLSAEPLRFRPKNAVTVVLAAEGYPGAYASGRPLRGLPDAVESGPDRFVFHAGVRADGDRLLTAGGRVIAVTGLGAGPEAARAAAYAAADSVEWDGRVLRRDIGAPDSPDSTGSPGSH